MSVEKMILRYKAKIEETLSQIVLESSAPDILKKAMDYSLSAGGKRLRPCMMLEFYRVLGKNPDDILNFACAVEMIHTYSLIHDDLPCMDDDDMRRGKASNHKVFGEANALLAGDALLTLAFETAANINENINPKNAVKAIALLANAAGMENMVGGQVLDLLSEGREITLDELEKIQSGKTVALIKVNASVACCLADADEATTTLMEKYCENIGKAFQIRDDILDVIGDESNLGKPIGSDEESQKNTFVSLIGLKHSQELVEKLTVKSKNYIRQISEETSDLRALADLLSGRKK